MARNRISIFYMSFLNMLENRTKDQYVQFIKAQIPFWSEI